MSLADLLRDTREAAGLSMASVAAHLGVHPATIWRWEHGQRVPSREHIQPLSELLRWSPGQAQAAAALLAGLPVPASAA